MNCILIYCFFHHQVLGQEISHLPLPDLALAAEHSDSVEMGRLLQLILGCAVKCEHKQGVLILSMYPYVTLMHLTQSSYSYIFNA